jgi:hypothetical protein
MLEPAGPAEMPSLLLALHDLTDREREVTELLVGGHGTDNIEQDDLSYAAGRRAVVSTATIDSTLMASASRPRSWRPRPGPLRHHGQRRHRRAVVLPR